MAVKHNPGVSVKLGALLDQVARKQLKVGWLESAQYPNGTPVAYVAAIQEFGSPAQGIPPRPFMRPTVEQQTAAWNNVAQQGAKAMLAGAMDAGGVMDMIGLKAAGDIAKTISKIQAPPLAPATIKARQRGYADQETVGNLTKPLVHTALMINSLTHIVEDK